jgi:ribosomal subunit interface protein
MRLRGFTQKHEGWLPTHAGTRVVSKGSMQIPLQVTFRDMPHSDALEAHVGKLASKLDTFSARITSCHVVLEAPHKHQHEGRHYRVRINLSVPGSEVVVSHTPEDEATNEDAYAAIDEAFDRLDRRLADYVRRQRGDVKPHETAYREGRVSKLWSYEGYGFIETPDSGEVYFHRNSVLHHSFDKLAIGTHVRFVEELGEKGPQASTVVLSGQ